jgi:cellulose synthase/poly-beta-1,6-N-acetylglucosamine synthase-like glycosyltransferase
VLLRYGVTALGADRNRLVAAARGEWIAHWDADDWSAPDRLKRMLVEAERSGKAVLGMRSMLFWDEPTGEVWRYRGIGNVNLGTSLFYRRDWWREVGFVATKRAGEDLDFVRRAAAAGELALIDDEGLMVARSHADNTCKRDYSGPEWSRASIDGLPEGFRRVEGLS